MVLSFFTGGMGLDIGLERAGIETGLACEVDKHARNTIKRNRPNLPVVEDILDYSSSDIINLVGEKDIFLIAGGPPCQAFSTAGKRRGFEDERGNVFLKYLEIIEDIKPKYFVIENVRGLLSTKFELEPEELVKYDIPKSAKEISGSALYYVCKRLESSGFNINFNLYNAANFGTPQSRERVVIIGTTLPTRVPFLMPTHSNIEEFNLPSWRSIREAFENLDYDNDAFSSLSEKSLKYLKLLGPGQYWKDLPEELQEEAMGGAYLLQGGKTGFYRRLNWDKPSPTVVTSPAMPATMLCHPEENRPLSIKEYARIQEFPDDWQFEGPVGQVYKQIGNAVPVGLGYAIGKGITNHFEGNPDKPPKGFKYSRYRNTSFDSFMRSVDDKIHVKTNLLF